MNSPSYGAAPTKLTQAEQDLLQSDRPGFGSRSRLEVAFNLVNATVGAGIIGLPFAIYNAGFYSGIILSIIVAFLSQLGLYMLVVSGQRTGIYKFAGLVEHVMGRFGYNFLNIMIVVQAGGACVSYYILIGDTIPVLFGLYLPDYPLLADRTFVILLIGVTCVFPLLLSRSIGALARWSIVSVLCLPLIILTLLVRAPVYAPQHDAPLTLAGGDIFGALGIMAFAFACSQVAFNNYLSQQDQTERGWAISTTLATVMSWVTSIAFAVVGYLSFGTAVQPNLFLNFPADDMVVNVGRFALGFSMILTIPMGFFPTREAVQKMLGFETDDRQPTQTQHYLVTGVIFGLITTLGVLVQSLGKVYSLIGGFAATTLAYILPATAYLVTRRTRLEVGAAKTPLLHGPSPCSSLPLADSIKMTWLDIAAGLLIVWGFMVMVFATAGVFTHP
ncbi:transmembrane amino acid transporter protein-domain-containing protein [Phycomyces nitens]|nr:transmembrane amino acid transporter protein-domain-containing protein [Phycomyces nitens]